MILVSGATGTIGKEVVKQLTALKAPFKVLARDPKKATDLLGKVEVAKGDFNDSASLEAALKGADKFFLLVNGSPDMARLEKNAITAAKKAGVKHVVYLSVLGADPGSPVKLAKWHAETEKELKGSGMAWTMIQPHFFMQNLLGNAGSIKSDSKIYAPMKKAAFTPVDSRDISAVIAHSLVDAGHEGKTYLVTGGEAVTFAQIASAISEVVGKKVEYIDIPDAALRDSLKKMGVPDWMIDDYSSLFGYFSTGAAAAVSDAVEKVAKKKPVTLQQFVKDHAAVFKG